MNTHSGCVDGPRLPAISEPARAVLARDAGGRVLELELELALALCAVELPCVS